MAFGFLCGEELYHKIVVSHQFVYSIGTSYNYECGPLVGEFDGPEADSRPSRYESPNEHVHVRLSRNLDADLNIYGKTRNIYIRIYEVK